MENKIFKILLFGLPVAFLSTRLPGETLTDADAPVSAGPALAGPAPAGTDTRNTPAAVSTSHVGTVSENPRLSAALTFVFRKIKATEETVKKEFVSYLNARAQKNSAEIEKTQKRTIDSLETYGKCLKTILDTLKNVTMPCGEITRLQSDDLKLVSTLFEIAERHESSFWTVASRGLGALFAASVPDGHENDEIEETVQKDLAPLRSLLKEIEKDEDLFEKTRKENNTCVGPTSVKEIIIMTPWHLTVPFLLPVSLLANYLLRRALPEPRAENNPETGALLEQLRQIMGEGNGRRINWAGALAAGGYAPRIRRAM